MIGKKTSRRAFTLTELLVVVVVVGVLAAVAVPQFNRVLETRRTTEAESLMTAVRTEQEKRCTFEKAYAGTFDRIGDIVSRNPSKTSTTASGSYTYDLEEQGIKAASNRQDYALKMLSYKDGRLCCDGAYCDSLNKSYPKCEGFGVEYDANCTASACELDPEGCACNPNQCKCPAYAASHCECSGTCVKTCEGAASQSCNTCGTQTRSCNTSTGVWNGWGSCSMTQAECDELDKEKCTNGETRGSASCNDCGKQTTEKCVNNAWTASLGACSKTQAQCDAEGEGEEECKLDAASCATEGNIFDAKTCECTACPEGETSKDGETCEAKKACPATCEKGFTLNPDVKYEEDGECCIAEDSCDQKGKSDCESTDGTWNEKDCKCSCDQPNLMLKDGKCIPKFKPKNINIGILVNCHYCPDGLGWRPKCDGTNSSDCFGYAETPPSYGPPCQEYCDPYDYECRQCEKYPGYGFDPEEGCSNATYSRTSPCYPMSYEFYVGGSFSKRKGGQFGKGDPEDAYLWWTGGERIGGQNLRYPGGSMLRCSDDHQAACNKNCDKNSNKCDYKCTVSLSPGECPKERYKYCWSNCAPTRYSCQNGSGTGVVMTCVAG